MGLGLTLTLVLGVLAILLAVRIPVAFALLLSGAFGLILINDLSVSLATVGSQLLQAPGRYVLVVVPMFIAMGVFALHGGVAEDAFAVASRLFGRQPGGLALASLTACAAFAAVSGSSVATVVAVGRPAIREMRRYGYSPSVAAGAVGAAGTLGVLIPPSVVLVVYGVTVGESIGRLLLAGIVPGVLSALAYALAIVLRARVRPELFGGDHIHDVELARQDREVLATQAVLVRRQTLSGLVKVGLLFGIIIGGIYSGTFTVIESAAVAALVALVFLVVKHSRKGPGAVLDTLRTAIGESASLSSMVVALLLGAAVFTSFLVSAAAPQSFTRWVLSAEVAPLLIVALLLLAFIPLGMFLDPLSIIVLAVPIAYPVVDGLGFDLIWFGILVVKTVEVGLITPPLGINAFVVAGAGDMPVEDAMRGVLWFVPIDLATIAVLFAFPDLVLWLPGRLTGGVM